jgi:tetratricopeptide (TPR) repeat protein
MKDREERSGGSGAGVPGDAAALRRKAELVGTERGRRNEAVDLWRRYLEVVEPAGTREALYELGRALVQARRAEEAIDVLRRCTMEWPGFFEAHALLGEVLKQTGDLEAAVEALKRATELSPGDVQPLASLAICLEALGRRSEADAALSALRESSAGNPAVWALMQELLQRRE